MKNRKIIATALLLVLIAVVGTGLYLMNKSGKSKGNGGVTADLGKTENISGEDSSGEDETGGKQNKPKPVKTDDLELKDVVVRYQEKISEDFHGEASGGYFYYIDNIPVYEKPGEDQAFLSVTDGSEVKNYGKKADFRRNGMTVLAKTIDTQGRFCQLEENADGKICLVVYGENGEEETFLKLEEKTLEADFSQCVLMVDETAVYVRAGNPVWKSLEDNLNSKTLFIFSRSGKLLYEDYIIDMEPDTEGRLVVLRERPEGGDYIEFLNINRDDTVTEESCVFATGRTERYLTEDRSTGSWYCLEAGRIEIFDIENVIPRDLESVLNYGTDTSFQLTEEATLRDYYDNDMELLDGQICDNGVINLMMGRREGEDFVYRLYQYSRYEETETDDTLVITVPYPIPLIKQAVTLYEKKYPESHVRIESAYDIYEDFKTYMNTYGEQMTARIMTGDFGDIICSSQGLYQELLLRSDAYMDLGDWVKTTESYENLNKGALKGLTVNGALRALPVGVDLCYYGVNEKLAKEEGISEPEELTWGQLLDIALRWKEEGKKQKTLFGSGIVGEDQLGYMIINNLRDLINVEEKSCNLRQEWFLELMKKWKEVYRSGHMYSYGQAEMYRDRNWEDTRFINGFEKGSLLQAYGRRALQFDWMDVSLTSEAEQFWRYTAKHDCPQELIGGINGEKSRNFSSYSSMMFSVNARAEHKEEALRFMEFLVGERVQRLDSVPGIPMNLAVDRENWEKASKSVTKEMETEYLTPEKVMEYYEQFSKIYEEIDMLYPSYYSLYIERPMMSYISGTMTLEEAIDKAEKDLWLHLNE